MGLQKNVRRKMTRKMFKTPDQDQASRKAMDQRSTKALRSKMRETQLSNRWNSSGDPNF